MFAGIGQTILHGFGFGAGSEIAHQSVRQLFQTNTNEKEIS